MNILFLCNEYPPYPQGGLGTFVHQIANYLANNGHNIFVYGIYPNISERVFEKDNNVTVIRDPNNFKNSKIGLLKKIYFIGKQINTLTSENNIDIVETDDTSGLFFGINKDKLVVRLHNSLIYLKKNRGRFNNIIEFLSFKIKNPAIIGVSEFILHKFENKFIIPSQKKIIYNGIDTNKIIENTTREKKVIFGGTIRKTKGIVILLEAFAQSKIHEQGYTLEIYGKDTLENSLSYFEKIINQYQEVKKLFDTKIINYHGAIANDRLLAEFTKADIAVFPSEFESFGIVVVEAMLQKCITIYTDQGATNEILLDLKEGFLFPVNDTNKLITLLQKAVNLSVKEKETIRKNAHQKAKQFSIENCTNQTLVFYQEFLRK